MALLPARNIFDGTATPVTSTMKTAMGSLRDYLAALLGTDSSNTAAARTALGAATAGANADITSLNGLTTPLSMAQGGSGSATAFNAIISDNGYQKLPSGLIIQWGSFNAPSNSTSTVTLPIAFPNNFYGVSVTVKGATGLAGSSPFSSGVPINLSTFSLRSYYSGSAISNFWIAFGF